MRYVIVLRCSSSLSYDIRREILATWAGRRSVILVYIHNLRHSVAVLSALLLAFVCVLQPNEASAANASEMFADGNRLFRDRTFRIHVSVSS